MLGAFLQEAGGENAAGAICCCRIALASVVRHALWQDSSGEHSLLSAAFLAARRSIAALFLGAHGVVDSFCDFFDVRTDELNE